MASSNPKTLTVQRLVRQIKASNRYGERFCFILGAGASVESGIPSGNSLEMKWMNEMMADPDEVYEIADDLRKRNLIEHPFEEIEHEWENAKKNNKSIPSKYYSDIYKLQFYPQARNGYHYLEEIMETCDPSLGYYVLSLMLTDSKRRNNLVITTNFDSLVEDALFLYTNQKPLAVSHESLVRYIDPNMQRPIIAKLHRGLMYEPFNDPKTTNGLKRGWRRTLIDAFNNYTPIVIGYGGGDQSLMSVLKSKNVRMRHGIYWCFRESSGLPNEDIQKLVEDKEGCFVEIKGFDALMMELGKSLCDEGKIILSYVEKYLKTQCNNRIQKYNKKWNDLNGKTELKPILQSINEAEQKEEQKREQANKMTEWDYLRRGNRAYEQKDYSKAVNEYTEAIKLNPDYASAYNNRGNAYDDLGQHEQAIQDYNKAIALNPDLAEAYNNRGNTYSNLGQSEQAIQDYNKAIALKPDYASAYNNRGNAYFNLGQYEQAIQDFTKAIMLRPDLAEAYNNRGIAYRKSGQYEQAIQDFTKTTELKPDDADAYNNRGNAYSNLGQYEQAIQDFTKAIELKPDYAEAYYNRGNAYSNLGQYEKAIQDFTKAITLKPDLGEAYYNRGNAYSNLGQYEQAIQDFTKAIALKPDLAEAYNNRGNAYSDLGQYEQAIQDYNKAIALKPDYAYAYNNRGNAYFNLGQYEQAIQDFTKAITLRPDYALCYRNRARAYRAIGKNDLAETDKKQAEQL